MHARSPRYVRLAVLILFAACGREGAENVPRKLPPETPSVPENVVDLTYGFGPETIYWPTDTQGFQLEVLAAGVTDQGYYYAANRYSSAEHGGTHLDAPIHFNAEGLTADALPVKRLVGLGAVVDVTEKAHRDRDYQVSVGDLELWEQLHGPLPEGAIVFLRTGFGRHWPDRELYLGTALTGPEAVPELHFPGLHPDAARWLAAERDVKAVGIDTPSIDHGQSTLFESHVALFAANVPAFENVANLLQVPDRDFLVVALPMKIEGGSGAPLRIVAMW
jgi:kynurenine formamidase